MGEDLVEAAVREFGEGHENHAAALNEHALSLRQAGEYTMAEPLFLQALEIGKKTIGETHPNYAIRLNNLAGLYRAMGEYTKAEPLYLEAIKIMDARLGADHPNMQTVKANYEHMCATRDGKV